MKNSAVGWTDHTTNFWWGCCKDDVDCAHCYAERQSKQNGKHDIFGPFQTTRREIKKGIWENILKWDKEAEVEGKRKRNFVMSMGDFLEAHPHVHEPRKRAITILESLKWQDILLLTKRPGNASDFLSKWFYLDWPKHIWVGTSAGNQETLEKRFYDLVNIPARTRFLSIEPLIGAVDLDAVDFHHYIHWVIVGGESGAQGRETELENYIRVIDQCKQHGIPVFVKQDNHLAPGQQGRIPDEYWIKQYPTCLCELSNSQRGACTTCGRPWFSREREWL